MGEGIIVYCKPKLSSLLLIKKVNKIDLNKVNLTRKGEKDRSQFS